MRRNAAISHRRVSAIGSCTLMLEVFRDNCVIAATHARKWNDNWIVFSFNRLNHAIFVLNSAYSPFILGESSTGNIWTPLVNSNENKHVSTLYGIFPISLAYVIKSRCQYLPPPWGRGQLLWSQSATTELSQWHTFERIHFFCCWATIHRQEFATCENEMYSRTFAIFAYTEHTYPSAVRPRQRAGCKSVWFLVWVKWNAPIHK